MSTRPSYNPSITADGHYVTFTSRANNLVLGGDTNGRGDVFLKDITTGAIQLVSVAADGTQGDSTSDYSSATPDGRYVVFQSFASNLVPDDTNGRTDIFLKDVTTGSIQRLSVAADGTQGNNSSSRPSITDDGRYVVFYSSASNLVPDDTNGRGDVFLTDLTAGTIERISVAADSTQGNNSSSGVSITTDGRYVVFYSSASNLVPDDTNSTGDIFLKDLTTGSIQLVSVAADGTQGSSRSFDPSITTDGRYVTFTSPSENLAPEYTVYGNSIFLKDLITGTVRLVSAAADHTSSNGDTYDPLIAADGSHVVFVSLGDNLVPNDSNGEYDVFRVANPLLVP